MKRPIYSLILMYCAWILAIRRNTQDIQWNVATSAGVSSWTTAEWNPVKALTRFHSAVVQEAVVRKRSTMLRLLKQKRSTSSTWREHLRSEETHKVISETSKLGLPHATTECDERMQWWVQKQKGFWMQQKDANTHHKQLTSKLLSCELLIVCTCSLLL